jgi:hypothetical protein
VEAAIETTNATLRNQVIIWIESLALAPVTPKLAAQKAKLYKPPKWSAPIPSRDGSKRVSRTQVGRLWIISSQATKLSEDEEGILDEQAESAKRFLKDKSRYEVDTIRFKAQDRFAREARLGHLAIVLHHEGKIIDVYPPARVIYVRAYTTGGVRRVGVHLERHTEDSLYYWSAFRRAALDAGVKLGKSPNREIRDAAAREPLLRFFGHRRTDLRG